VSTMDQKKVARLKRKVRVRKKVLGDSERPRLNVFRSAKHMYAQLIDDTTGTTLATATTRALDAGVEVTYTGNISAAQKVGAAIAKKALACNITKVVFDRNGFLYHGRVKALADAARENGLSF
jgi:large subunit ribosomal protein L18